MSFVNKTSFGIIFKDEICETREYKGLFHRFLNNKIFYSNDLKTYFLIESSKIEKFKEKRCLKLPYIIQQSYELKKHTH